MIMWWVYPSSISHFRITFGLFLKRGLLLNDWYEKNLLCIWTKSYNHMKGWAPGLALKMRLTVIRKRPIVSRMDRGVYIDFMEGWAKSSVEQTSSPSTDCEELAHIAFPSYRLNPRDHFPFSLESVGLEVDREYKKLNNWYEKYDTLITWLHLNEKVLDEKSPGSTSAIIKEHLEKNQVLFENKATNNTWH